MPDAEKAEIISDLRNHIDERVADSNAGETETVTETLAALGSPESLAASYRRERLIARASASAEPALLLRATFRVGARGAARVRRIPGVVVRLLHGIGFLVCAFLKPFLPNQIGLWIDPPAFSLGYLDHAGRHGQELLGWWLIPVGYIVGPLAVLWTTALCQAFCVVRRGMWDVISPPQTRNTPGCYSRCSGA